MKSEDYRQLLNNERDSLEMTSKEYDNTLMHFAKLYYQEQQCNIGDVSKRSELLEAFVDEYIEAWNDGMAGSSSLLYDAKKLKGLL